MACRNLIFRDFRKIATIYLSQLQEKEMLVAPVPDAEDEDGDGVSGPGHHEVLQGGHLSTSFGVLTTQPTARSPVKHGRVFWYLVQNDFSCLHVYSSVR